jgi:hypothetical protein
MLQGSHVHNQRKIILCVRLVVLSRICLLLLRIILSACLSASEPVVYVKDSCAHGCQSDVAASNTMETPRRRARSMCPSCYHLHIVVLVFIFVLILSLIFVIGKLPVRCVFINESSCTQKKAWLRAILEKRNFVRCSRERLLAQYSYADCARTAWATLTHDRGIAKDTSQ